MTTHERPSLLTEPGVRLAVANGLVVLVLCLCEVVRLGPDERIGAVLVAGGALAFGLPLAMTVWTGVVGWALVTGFVVNGLGTLTFTADDLVRLGCFAAGVPLLAALVALAVDRRRRQSPSTLARKVLPKVPAGSVRARSRAKSLHLG